MPFHCLDDNEFLHVIFEQQHGSVHYDSDRLASLKFNPLLTDVYCHQHLTTTYDLETDSNFNAGSNICDYLIEEQFNEIIKSRINNRDNFSLLHLNIRSLQANLDRLTELLSCLSSQFSVIAITETCLRDKKHLVDIKIIILFINIVRVVMGVELVCTYQNSYNLRIGLIYVWRVTTLLNRYLLKFATQRAKI